MASRETIEKPLGHVPEWLDGAAEGRNEEDTGIWWRRQGEYHKS